MKSFVREVRNSFYNPRFYKEIPGKSEAHIFEYTTKLTILLGIIYLVLLLALFQLNADRLPDVSTPVFAMGILVGILMPVLWFTVVTFVALFVFSYAFALLAYLIALFLNYQIRYDSVRKMSIYAITPVIILYTVMTIFRLPPLSIYLAILLSLGVFLINNKKGNHAST